MCRNLKMGRSMWIGGTIFLLGVAAAIAAEPEATGTSTSGVRARPQTVCNAPYVSTETCQNFPRICLNEINDQINVGLDASYTYQSMGTYFNRDDVSYRGFAKFFSKMAEERREHAEKLMTYMNKRGGRVHYKKLSSPKSNWNTPITALEFALSLERSTNDQLLDIHWIAVEKNDPHLADYLESDFLTEQVEIIKKMGDWLAILRRLNTPSSGPLGITIFDQELYEGRR